VRRLFLMRGQPREGKQRGGSEEMGKPVGKSGEKKVLYGPGKPTWVI